jgi:hypothetical protein
VPPIVPQRQGAIRVSWSSIWGRNRRSATDGLEGRRRQSELHPPVVATVVPVRAVPQS